MIENDKSDRRIKAMDDFYAKFGDVASLLSERS